SLLAAVTSTPDQPDSALDEAAAVLGLILADGPLPAEAVRRQGPPGWRRAPHPAPRQARPRRPLQETSRPSPARPLLGLGTPHHANGRRPSALSANVGPLGPLALASPKARPRRSPRHGRGSAPSQAGAVSRFKLD